MSRPTLPREKETEVLTRSKRRCCLCFVLDGDEHPKDGQIAHLDRNPANNNIDNLAYLCLVHHAEYDASSPQRKGLQPDELKVHREAMYALLERGDAPARLKLVIERDFDSFSDAELMSLQQAITVMAAVEGGVRVVRREKGSIILTLEMNAGAAFQVLKAIRKNSLPEATISSIVLTEEPQVDLNLTFARGQFSEAYEILPELGRGGMGHVFRARQIALGRHVALKLLHDDKITQQTSRDRLRWEAEVLAQLDHPNIVPIYGYAEDKDFGLFYSMKEIKGRRWKEVIGQDRRRDLEILLDVANALEFAHSKDIYHLDLKPSNIMLGQFGEVLVTDWGTAKTPGGPTEDGERGTPEYAPPECARGEFDDMGPHSDIYLLGALLFEIITGLPPRDRHEVGSPFFRAARNEIRETDVSGELMDIAMIAMSRESTDRYQDVEEFRKRILAYQEHAKSLERASRAEEDFQAALRSTQNGPDYSLFQMALTGFEAAHDTWEGNLEALERSKLVRYEYATCAFENEDYDHAVSLLDRTRARHVQLATRIEKAREASRRRSRRIKTLRWTLAVAALMFGLVTSFSALWIWQEQRDTEAARKAEEIAKGKANEEAGRARAAETDALEQRDKAFSASVDAVLASIRAEVDRQRAFIARSEAVQSENRSQWQAYVALIGAASARIDENAFQKAENLLVEARGLDKTLGTDDSTRQADADSDYHHPSNWLTQAWEPGQHANMFAVSQLLGGRPVPNESMVTPWDEHLADALEEGERRLKVLEDTGEYRADAVQQAQEQFATLKRELSLSPQLEAPISDARPLVNWEWGRLWYLCNQFVINVRSQSRINVVLFGLDGEHFLTGSESGELTWWCGDRAKDDLRYSAKRRLFVGGRVFAADLKLCGNRARLALGTNDSNGFVKLWEWDAKSPYPEAESVINLPGHRDSVVSVSFSHDGQLLLTSSYDGTARIWDLNNRTRPRVLRGHEGAVWAAAFSPVYRGRHHRIVTAGDDGVAVVWDDPDGLWNENSRVRHPCDPLVSHQGPVYATTFLTHGRFVTAGQDGRVLVWNVPYRSNQLGGAIVPVLDRRLLGHGAAVRCVRRLGQGQLLLTCGDDHTIRIWNVEREREIQALRGHSGAVRSCDYDAESERVLSGGYDETAKLWPMAAYGQTVVFGARLLDTDQQGFLTANFSPDGKSVVTAGLSRKGRVRPVTRSLHDAEATEPVSVELAEGHDAPITNAAFLPDGRLLTSSIDESVRVWGPDGLKLAKLHSTGRAGVLALSPDGNWMATGSNQTISSTHPHLKLNPEIERRLSRLSRLQGNSPAWYYGVQLWRVGAALGVDTTDAPSPEVIYAGIDEITAIAFSEDSQTLFTGDVNGRCMLWNLREQKLVWGVDAHHKRQGEEVFSVGFLRGDRVFSASRDGTIVLWSRSAGREVQRLLTGVTPAAREATLQSVVISADETPSSVADKIVRALNPHSLAISPDRSHLAAVYSDGVIRVADVSGKADFTNFRLFLPAGDDSRLLAANLQRLMFDRGWNAKALSQQGVLSEQQIQNILTNQPTIDVGKIRPLVHQTIRKLDSNVPSGAIDNVYLSSVVFSQNGGFLAAAAPDRGKAYFWIRGRSYLRAEERDLSITAEDFNNASASRLDTAFFAPSSGPHLRLLTLGGNTARLWQTQLGPTPSNGRTWEEIQRFGPHSAITSAHISPDGRWVATGSWDGWVKIWNRDGDTVGKLQHPNQVNSVSFIEADERLQLLTACSDGDARLWNLGSPSDLGKSRPREPYILQHCEVRAEGEDNKSQPPALRVAMAFTRQTENSDVDVSSILTAGDDGIAVVWDRVGESWNRRFLLSPDRLKTSVARRPHRSSPRGYLCSRNYRTDAPEAPRESILPRNSDAAPEAILCADVSRDGRYLATGGRDRIARIWALGDGGVANEAGRDDASTARPIVLQHTAPVTAVAFSPDARRVFTSSRDKTTRVWDRQTGRELIALEGHSRAVTSVDVPRNWPSEGPRYLLTCSRDGTAILWPAEDWEQPNPCP